MFALTERLTLRPGWPEDAPALARAIGHRQVVMNLAKVPWPYTLGDAQWWLAQPRGATEPTFQICERASDRLIGGIGLIPGAQAMELGYWLAPEAWGKGYATEAGRAVLAMAPTLGHRRIAARHYVDNPASGRVLTKLGFRVVGPGRTHSLARGGAVDCIEMMLDPDEERTGAPSGPVALAA